MKIELSPIQIRRTFSTSSSPQNITAATSTELSVLVREMQKRGRFDELKGQFRIYRENNGPIILELVTDENLLDAIEKNLEKQNDNI